MQVSMTINGADVSHDVEPRTLLVHFIREDAGLTGTNIGCDSSSCGACTIHVNGEAVKSCTMLAVQADGQDVTTIEGLGTPDEPSALQKAFVEHDGYQCGYCTPGQICSATAMLTEIANGWPSDASKTLEGDVDISGEEIRERMSGNLCRCGAYANIVAAIRDVAGEAKA